MADIFDKLESDISQAITRYEEAGKTHLLMLKAKDDVETEWGRLTALQLLDGSSMETAIGKVHATSRGQELADLIRIRRADSDLSRQEHNRSLFAVEVALLRARWETIREEGR